MGLDMFVYKVKAEDGRGSLKFKYNDPEELQYYRKHHDLHGWMRNLYWDKGGNEEFNGDPVQLTLEDLDQLEKDIIERNLPETSGFFFGNYPPNAESAKKDLDMVKRAREAINEGYLIYYNSSW